MTTQTQIDLTPFCDSEGSRLAIDKPFVQRGWLNATDGRILVSVRAEGEPDTVTGKRVPNCGEIYRSKPTTGYQPWPPANYTQKLGECLKCKGSGYAHFKDCLVCGGEGVVECHECHNEEECDECGGEGVVGCGKCSRCDGAKEAMQDNYTMVGEHAIAAKYDKLIRALPNVQFAQKDDTTFFEFDGGRGGIMRLNIGDKP